MNWDKLLSTKKFKVESGEISEYISGNKFDNPTRTDYNQDHDRIVFSRSFRRLGKKTQVHPFSKNDHTHNRLIHSVEVGAVGRSIGIKVADTLKSQDLLPEKYNAVDIGVIVQAACLAHDIGNPPFGHAGEESLRHWFREESNQKFFTDLSSDELLDLKTYEGNAHALRIVCTTEMYKNQGGMRLTCATLGTLLKYPWISSLSVNEGKFNIYQSELNYFKFIAQELGLKEIIPNKKWARHPLSYLMEAADDICYGVLDLEEAVEMGIITFDEFCNLFEEIKKEIQDPPLETNQCCAAIRSKFIGKCIDFVSEEFIRNYDAIMNGNFTQPDFFKNSQNPIAIMLNSSKKLAQEKIYNQPNKVKREIGSYPCLHHLLNLFIPAVNEFYEKEGCLKSLSGRNKSIINLLDKKPNIETKKYQAYLEVLDFIGGMTDNYAINLATETSGFSKI